MRVKLLESSKQFVDVGHGKQSLFSVAKDAIVTFPLLQKAQQGVET